MKSKNLGEAVAPKSPTVSTPLQRALKTNFQEKELSRTNVLRTLKFERVFVAVAVTVLFLDRICDPCCCSIVTHLVARLGEALVLV